MPAGEPPAGGATLAGRTRGTFIFLAGYLLSPLTWWNDAVVNLPIAWALASAISWAYPSAFTPALVIAYWGTNVLGLLMMGSGAARALDGRGRGRFVRFALLCSAAYTILILILVRLGVARPLPTFWQSH